MRSIRRRNSIPYAIGQRLCLVAVLGLPMMAAQSASITANSGATIISPMTLTKTADLVFGTVAPTASAGTVVMSAAGARTGSNVVLSSLAAGNAASFTVAGNPNTTFSVTLPGSAATLTGPGANMSVGTFTSTPSATGTLNGSGSATLNVGATLSVGASQVAGSYTGSFTVTVNYN